MDKLALRSYGGVHRKEERAKAKRYDESPDIKHRASSGIVARSVQKRGVAAKIRSPNGFPRGPKRKAPCNRKLGDETGAQPR